VFIICKYAATYADPEQSIFRQDFQIYVHICLRPSRLNLDICGHICIFPDMPAFKPNRNLARLRQHLRLTQGQVAHLAGCSRIAIQSIERGILALSKTMAAKLQSALHRPADWLLANDPKSPIPEPLRVSQDGQLLSNIQFGIVEQLANAIKLTEISDEQGVALLQIYTAEYITALRKTFARNYPDLIGPEAIEYFSALVEMLKRQYPAQKAKPRHPKARSRNRQSA
jgi:transcriptional regulator with XRE-family HTH domain